ncbi:PliI family lysozyme inhibitor of I-type lysozyme [Haloferula sp.]|uniref:PliI family lysozyme inhibitor of I-type lysozyme n=1 Tax=Haloferula sp. TaxID=2497595 RepID=UPI00329C9535
MTTTSRLGLMLISLSASGLAAESPPAYEKAHSLQGITFTINCPNEGSLNKATLSTKGLEGENAPITLEIDGTITGSEVADLNADGSPEIYIFTASAGSGSYAGLVAYSTNSKKSLTAIYLPELGEDKKNSAGYMGHDQFAIVESVLARRFPLYEKKDSNAKPTGKTRQLQYKLKAGEAGWVLKLEKSTDY